MKMITWNLNYWRSSSTHEEAWRYLRKTIKPHLALLQEIRPPKLMPGETLVFQKYRDYDWGTAIYSRGLPLEEIPLSADYPGRVAGALVSLRDGRRLHIASIHAKIAPNLYQLSNIMEDIMETFADQTAIVGGDLNTSRLRATLSADQGYRLFWERMDSERIGFVDCYKIINGEGGRSFFGGAHPDQLDHLFVSRDLVLALEGCDMIYNEVTRKVSDHLPLFIEVDV